MQQSSDHSCGVRACILAAALSALTFLAPTLNDTRPGRREESPVTWITLAPESTRSAGGATLSVESDGTIVVGGDNPDKDTHTIVVSTHLKNITGLRLEALPDGQLAARGPGRAHNGNFVLSEMTVQAAPRITPGSGRPIAFKTILANHSQDGWPVASTVDGSSTNGWAALPKLGHRLVASYELVEPINHSAGSVLTFILDFQFGQQHVLGRYRLSLTTDLGPFTSENEESEGRWSEIQGKINDAIERGCRFLLSEQNLDGGFSYHAAGYPSGSTALALYALVKSGVSKDHPSVRRAAAFVRCHHPHRTYSAGCHLLSLCALDDPADKALIERTAQDLASWQRRKGGFGYPDGEIDLSNSQYAALGLRAAANHGVKIDRSVWEELAARTLMHQKQEASPYAPAGFGYHPVSRPSGSITSAGVGILAICEEQLGRRSDISTAIKKGIQWLAQNFSANSNPVQGEGAANTWLYYYLYGMERVGGLTGLNQFGPHDWYREGSRFLVEAQEPVGSWPGDKQSNTCFALLFLSRATSSATGASIARSRKLYGSDDSNEEVNIRASGDSPLSMWISSFGDKTGQTFAWPGEASLGPHVAKVEYIAFPAEREEEPQVIAQVAGDASRPSGRERFAAQYAFKRPGRYLVLARVTVVTSGPEGAPKVEEVLESEPLEVEISEVLDPVLVRYADDAMRDLLDSNVARARASSEWSGDHAAVLSIDQILARGWLSKDNDPKPWVVIEVLKPVRANLLLLSPFQHSDHDRDLNRPAKVEVILNGKKPGFVVDIDPDPSRKTEVTIERPAPVRTLEIRVLEVSEGHPEKRGVGFAEIELQHLRGAAKAQ